MLLFLFILFILPKISLLAPNSDLSLIQVFYDPANESFSSKLPSLTSSVAPDELGPHPYASNSMSTSPSLLSMLQLKGETTLTEPSPLRQGTAP